MLIWLALACSDPDFGHLGHALDAYDEGRAALSTGAPMVAAEAFARAAAADPGSYTLVAWEARALRQAGQEGTALNRLNAGLKRFPDASVLRYDRAALRAKMGDISGASDDLRWLYANELANPISVGEDPDFISLRTDATARTLVPPAQVEASVEVNSPTVLVGESYALDFRITSRTGVPLVIKAAGDDPALMHMIRIVEDLIAEGDIWSQRRISVEVRATTPGKIAVGPWMVESASTSVLTERVIIDAVDIQGRGGDSAGQGYMPLLVPSTLWSSPSLPLIAEQAGSRWALLGPGHIVRPDGAKTGLHVEYREGGQPQWVAWQVSSASEVELWDGVERVSTGG